MVYSASAQTPEPAPNETNERTNACDGETIVRERELSNVRANGGRSSCNEIQPHWIHGAVSGVERFSLLKFLIIPYERDGFSGALGGARETH